MKKYLIAVSIILLAISSPIALAMAGNSKPAAFADKTMDIRNYGAIADGKTVCTKAIQAAIDECAKRGGGTVTVPAGRFVSGTIIMKNNVELHVAHGAVLLGSTNASDYPCQPIPKYRSHKDRAGGFYSLIYAEGAQNIAVTGTGTIDGRGKGQIPVYDTNNDIDGRPRLILFISCRNIRVEGLYLRNSGIWLQHYLDCDNVIVRGLDVWNHSMRNNDAIDIDGCRRVTISDCHFDTDDDGITLKSTGSAPTEHVTITNCTVSTHCNAIKAGTESTGGFRNITISNCVITPSANPETIFGPRNGVTGIALMTVDGGVMEGITINNIVIEGTQLPLFIRLGNRARLHTKGAPKPPVAKVRNIVISNIVAYGTGKLSSSITGIPGHYVENVSLSNIQFFSKGGVKNGEYKTKLKELEKGYPQGDKWGTLPSFGLFMRHVRGITIDGFVMGVEQPDARYPLWAEDVQGMNITGCTVTGPVSKDTFLHGSNLSNYKVDKPLGWKKQVVTISDQGDAK